MVTLAGAGRHPARPSWFTACRKPATIRRQGSLCSLRMMGQELRRTSPHACKLFFPPEVMCRCCPCPSPNKGMPVREGGCETDLYQTLCSRAECDISVLSTVQCGKNTAHAHEQSSASHVFESAMARHAIYHDNVHCLHGAGNIPRAVLD